MYARVRASSVALCLAFSVNCLATHSALAFVQKRASAVQFGQEGKLSTNLACKDAKTYMSKHDFHQGEQGELLNGKTQPSAVLSTAEKDAAMKHFIRGIIEDLHGKIVNEHGLEDLVPLFSGSIDALPFRTLMEKLRATAAQTDSWLVLPDPNAVTHAEKWNLEHQGQFAANGAEIDGNEKGGFQFPRNVGRFAPLNEHGYSSVVAAKDNHEMANFVVRALHNQGLVLAKGGGAGNADLQGLVPWYSGACAVQSLQRLNTELSGAVAKGWVVEDLEAKKQKEDEAKANALYEAHQEEERLDAARAHESQQQQGATEDNHARQVKRMVKDGDVEDDHVAHASHGKDSKIVQHRSEREAAAHHSHHVNKGATNKAGRKHHETKAKVQKHQKEDSKTHKDATSERKQVASKMAPDMKAEPETENVGAPEDSAADDSIISHVEEKAEEVKEVLSEKVTETQELVSQKVEEAKEVVSEKTKEAEEFIAEKAEEVKGFVGDSVVMDKEMVAPASPHGKHGRKHGKHATKQDKKSDANPADKKDAQSDKSAKKHAKHEKNKDGAKNHGKNEKNEDGKSAKEEVQGSEETAKDEPQSGSWFSWMKR